MTSLPKDAIIAQRSSIGIDAPVSVGHPACALPTAAQGLFAREQAWRVTSDRDKVYGLVPLLAGLQAKDLCALDRRHLDYPSLLLHRGSSPDDGTGPARLSVAANLDAATDTYAYPKLAADSDASTDLYADPFRDTPSRSQRHLYPHAHLLAHRDPYAPQHEHADEHSLTNSHAHSDPHRDRHSDRHPYLNFDQDADGHEYVDAHPDSDGHQHTNPYPHPNLDANAEPDTNNDPDPYADANAGTDRHSDHNPELFVRRRLCKRETRRPDGQFPSRGLCEKETRTTIER